MIKLLSTLNPEHKFFSQRPEGIRSKSVMVNNHDGLFTPRFTPIQRKNAKRPKRYLPFLTKEQKIQIKLEKAKLRQAVADTEVMKLQKEMMTLTTTDEVKPTLNKDKSTIKMITTANGKTIEVNT